MAMRILSGVSRVLSLISLAPPRYVSGGVLEVVTQIADLGTAGGMKDHVGNGVMERKMGQDLGLSLGFQPPRPPLLNS